MDKEKEIEELAKVLDKAKEMVLLALGCLNGFGIRWVARIVYNAGYRKIDDLREQSQNVTVKTIQALQRQIKSVEEKTRQETENKVKKLLEFIQGEKPDCEICDEQWFKGCQCGSGKLKADLYEEIYRLFGVMVRIKDDSQNDIKVKIDLLNTEIEDKEQEND